MNAAAERFARDTAQHRLTVVLEDGVHRHLVARDPARSAYWFEVITWPGNLVITGDMGTFVFRRLDDMLEFFSGPGINPQYWAEKLTAGADDATMFSPSQLRLVVTEYWRDHVQRDPSKAGAGELWSAIESEVLANSDGYTTADAHRVLAEFEHDGFQFVDSWEHDLTDWSTHFLWCCYAVRWMATTHRKAAPTAAEPTSEPAVTRTGVITTEPQEQFP